MDPAGTERRLAAILLADVVGYGRLMGDDDEATVGALKSCRSQIGGRVREHGGRVVDAEGDGVLAEFPSAIDAVACAVTIQETLSKESENVAPDRRMVWRIGVHLGDVLVDGARIYGDGVNIAARLESLAEPGGVSISGTVHDLVHGKLALDFEDLGEQQLKNIARPVQLLRVRAAATDASATATTVPGFAARPAIAVLAFENLSGDPEQEYFADGLAEELIARLSLRRWFPVIARNSSFAYKGEAVDIKRIGRELGVLYVVEGSVRRAAGRVRTSAQLIDASTGHQLWGERYDRDLGDALALQDEIALAVCGAIDPELRRAEPERAMRRPTRELDAWEMLHRGIWHLRREETRENIERARTFFLRAAELAPDFGAPLAYHAITLILGANRGWTESRRRTLDEAFALATAAVALENRDPNLHDILGSVHLARGELDRAIASQERAIELDPSFALSYASLGQTLALAGRGDEALGMLNRAARLSPNDPLSRGFHSAKGIAHFVAGRYAEASECLERSRETGTLGPNTTAILVATYALLGRDQDARRELDGLLREFPALTLGTVKRIAGPFALRDKVVEGLRKAGIQP